MGVQIRLICVLVRLGQHGSVAPRFGRDEGVRWRVAGAGSMPIANLKALLLDRLEAFVARDHAGLGENARTVAKGTSDRKAARTEPVRSLAHAHPDLRTRP